MDFSILTLISVALLAVTSALLTDYRGLLTKYSHRLFIEYQKPRYRRMRTFYGESWGGEDKIRLVNRMAAALGAAMGIFTLVIEITALVTGHVA
jgi:hypothetical protein